MSRVRTKEFLFARIPLARLLVARWRGNLLWFCVLIAMLVVWWEFKQAGRQRRIEDRRVLILSHNLPESFPIQPSDFTFRFDEPDDSAALLSDQDFFLIQGAKTARALHRGSSVTLSDFLLPSGRQRISERVPDGNRAYALSVQRAPELVAGDRIDLLFQPFTEPRKSVVALEGALLLGAIEGEDSSEILLALSPSEIEAVSGLRLRGSLSAVLRNPREPVPRSRLKQTPVRRLARKPRVWVEEGGG